jgi:hypothetical protein
MSKPNYKSETHGMKYVEGNDKGQWVPKSFKESMKEIRVPLQKVVGHKRRERHSTAKKQALEKAMSPAK